MTSRRLLVNFTRREEGAADSAFALELQCRHAADDVNDHSFEFVDAARVVMQRAYGHPEWVVGAFESSLLERSSWSFSSNSVMCSSAYWP